MENFGGEIPWAIIIVYFISKHLRDCTDFPANSMGEDLTTVPFPMSQGDVVANMIKELDHLGDNFFSVVPSGEPENYLNGGDQKIGINE